MKTSLVRLASSIACVAILGACSFKYENKGNPVEIIKSSVESLGKPIKISENYYVKAIRISVSSEGGDYLTKNTIYVRTNEKGDISDSSVMGMSNPMGKTTTTVSMLGSGHQYNIACDMLVECEKQLATLTAKVQQENADYLKYMELKNRFEKK